MYFRLEKYCLPVFIFLFHVSLFAADTANYFDSGWLVSETNRQICLNLLKHSHFKFNSFDSGIETSADTFEFFLNNPDVAGEIINKTRIAKCKITRSDTDFYADDCAGVTVNFVKAYFTPGKYIFLGHGGLKNFFKANGIVCIEYSTDTQNCKLSFSATPHIKLNSGFLYLMTLLFKPIISHQCEKKFNYYISKTKKFFEYLNKK